VLRTRCAVPALCAALLLSSCTTPPPDARSTLVPRFTVIPTVTPTTRTLGIAPVAAIEGSSASFVDSVALDRGALSILFSGLDRRLHLGRVFPQGDLQDLPLEMPAQSSPWGFGLHVVADGSRWVGSYRSVVHVRADNSLEEVPIPASRPPGLAAEAGRNGEVTAMFADETNLYLGRAGIPVLTRVDLSTSRIVTLALPPNMPDVGTIARGPGGDLYLAANHRATRFAPEPTARLRLATDRIDALPYRGKPLAAKPAWLAIATPEARLLDGSLSEARAPIPAAQFDPSAFDVLPNGEFVTVDRSEAALLFYDLTGNVARRVPFQARVTADGRQERPPHFVVADGTAVWLVWGLDVFHVS
jgi:hypothetical protein